MCVTGSQEGKETQCPFFTPPSPIDYYSVREASLAAMATEHLSNSQPLGRGWGTLMGDVIDLVTERAVLSSVCLCVCVLKGDLCTWRREGSLPPDIVSTTRGKHC